MPQRQSGKKHLRADARKAEVNRRVRSATRTAVKLARSAITGQADDAPERLRIAVSHLDKAAKKGVIKKATAGRNKSRLMRLQNSQQSEAEA